jgi:hypothetical protein
LWTSILLDLSRRLPVNFWRAHALASALGDTLDNAPEPQREYYVRDVLDRLPAWLVEGLREAAQ